MILPGDLLLMRYWIILGSITRVLSQDYYLHQLLLAHHQRLTSDNSLCQVKEVVVQPLPTSLAPNKLELVELSPPPQMMPGALPIDNSKEVVPQMLPNKSSKPEKLRSGSRNGLTTPPSMVLDTISPTRLPVCFSTTLPKSSLTQMGTTSTTWSVDPATAKTSVRSTL